MIVSEVAGPPVRKIVAAGGLGGPAESKITSIIGTALGVAPLADAQAIAVRIGQLHFACPGLIENGGGKFERNRIDLAHVKVNQRVGSGVTAVLG